MSPRRVRPLPESFIVVCVAALLSGGCDAPGSRGGTSTAWLDATASSPDTVGTAETTNTARPDGLGEVASDVVHDVAREVADEGAGEIVEGDASPPPNRAPQILSLSPNTATLDEGETLIVTAIVTDQDGIDDLIGGELVDVATGGSYGAFATSAAEGSYALVLTWDALEVVNAFDAPPAGAPLALKARFFDASGAEAVRQLSVTVRCDGTGKYALCGGACTDWKKDPNHCGACDAKVPWDTVCVNGHPGCTGGLTLCGNECSALAERNHCGSCEHDCEARVTAGSGLSEAQCWSPEVQCSYKLSGLADRFEAGATCRALCGEKELSCDPREGYVGELTAGGTKEYLSCDEPYAGGANVSAGSCYCKDEGGGAAEEPKARTIEDIQQSSESQSCYLSGDVRAGGPYVVEGVVVVPRFQLSTNLAGLYLSSGSQYAYSGILVRFPADESWDFAVGDRVRVTGDHYEYWCYSQLEATAMTRLGTAAVPAAGFIAKDESNDLLEDMEGVYVQVQDVEVLWHTDYGEAATDGNFFIDDAVLGGAFELPEVGTHYPVLYGIVVWAFGKYRIAPTSADDY